MANASPLGGSPLGLIGMRSFYGRSGLSTFNAGKSRNVRVADYNRNKSDASQVQGNSLFSGYRVFRAWPEVNANDPGGSGDVDYAARTDLSKRPSSYHQDSIYDVSVLNIIEKLAGTKASLRPGDFAYLKNLGVYPNNRLMIARRFGSPAGDNIMVGSGEIGSYGTLISWVPENENFLEISFGEEWVESEADFKTILTSLGEDFGIGNLGGISGAAGNVIPLPGFTEIFQRQFLASLGLLESASANTIPAGNPNLIKTSRRRKLIGYSEAGSGLKCTVNIKMSCEYELKYISGIDPTLVWMDLLGMITRFGTSNSDTYGLSGKVGQKLTRWANNPNTLIKDIVDNLSDAMDAIVEKVKKLVQEAYDKAVDVANKLSDEVTQATDKAEKPKEVSPQDKALGEASKTKEEGFKFANLISTAIAAAKKTLYATIQKYRIRILGVVHSLSGMASTPWHITVGNPMRPTFCAGDMLVENVALTLGPTLAFNDLPSSIKVDFDMTNARPWGMQEIMAKFNSGYLRTIDAQKSFFETNLIKNGDAEPIPEPMGRLPLDPNSIPPTGGKTPSSVLNATGITPSGITPSIALRRQQTIDIVQNSENLVTGLNSNKSIDIDIWNVINPKVENGKLPVNTNINKQASDLVLGGNSSQFLGQ
jgi:hypothetical protein